MNLGHREAIAEVERLEARVAELEAKAAALEAKAAELQARLEKVGDVLDLTDGQIAELARIA